MISSKLKETITLFACCLQPIPPSPVSARKISFNGLKETIVLPQQAGMLLVWKVVGLFLFLLTLQYFSLFTVCFKGVVPSLFWHKVCTVFFFSF